MNYNAEGLPYVDVRDCPTPRDVLRRVESFLDELYDAVLRTYAAKLVLEDRDCADISARIARMRVTLLDAKLARLGAVVTILEDVANT